MKNAMITGASRGIGRAVALAFAGAGYNVGVISSKSPEELEKLAAEIERMGVKAVPVTGDISDYRQAERIFSVWWDSLGHTDVLVNNAGISHYGLFQEMEPEEWRRLTEVNMYSVLNCCRLAVPAMVSRRKGCIINISSVWGQRGGSCEAVYSMTKAGIDGFTRALSRELGPSGIRVNAIAPGLIETGMNSRFSAGEKEGFLEEVSLGRAGRPEEVGELALFLASDKGEYINGQVINLDGGFI